MHHVFVNEPSGTFHQQKCNQRNNQIHNLIFINLQHSGFVFLEIPFNHSLKDFQLAFLIPPIESSLYFS